MLALPGGASAAEFCVPDTSIAATCTSGHATPQAAVDAAVTAAGADTVRLGAGTFTTAIAKTSSVALTTIVGAGQGLTTIQGATSSTPLVNLQGLFVVRDLTIRATAGGNAAVVLGSSARMQSVTAERTGAMSSYVVSISGDGGATPGISDSTLRAVGGDNYILYSYNTLIDATSIEAGPATAITYLAYLNATTLRRTNVSGNVTLAALYATGSATITDSVVRPTSTTAAALTALTAFSNTTVTVADSSLIGPAGSTAAALEAGSFQDGWTATITASGIASSGFTDLGCAGTANFVTAAATVTASHSVASPVTLTPCSGGGYTNVGTETLTPGAGLLSASPGFTDASTGDVHLVAGAPAIDAGDPSVLPASPLRLDFYGLAREVDGNGDGTARRDAGAAEYAPPVIVPPTPTPPGPETPPVVDPTPKPAAALVSFKRSGRFTAPSRRATGTLLRSATASKRTGTKAPGRFALAFTAAPGKVTFTLSKRATGKTQRYVTLKGTETLTFTSAKPVLRLSGRWAKKIRVTAGSYRLKTTVAGVTKTVSFTVR